MNNLGYVEPKHTLLSNVRVAPRDAILALKMLVEGCGIRATSRLTELEKKTVLKLLLKAGAKAERLLDRKVRGVRAGNVQADEIWTYVYKKDRRVKPSDPAEYGDQYIYIALAAGSKLVLNYAVGKRDEPTTFRFIAGLKCRVRGRFQLTTDGWPSYPTAVRRTFNHYRNVDFAQTTKEVQPDGSVSIGIANTWRGDPDPALISTSYVERLNGTLRHSIRRMTRKTYAFSKSLKHLQAAVALFFAHYNFCRIHGTLQVTPAMEAGLTDHEWSMEEMLRAA